ncbi:hypothetical protein OROHE_024890 [Orobanche hederae]
MGACASVLKANKGDETVAPPPEQPVEVTPATATEVVAEAAAEGGNDDKEEEKAAGEESDKSQSFGTSLVEGEAPKEIPNGQESTADVLPISEPAAPVEEKSTDAAAPQPAVVAA